MPSRGSLAIAAFASAALARGGSHAAVLNGSYNVTPTTTEIGIVNDLPGITNLVLTNGVPQIVDLFDIFSTAPVTPQSISVTFDLAETGGGTFIATVQGSIQGLPDLDNPGMVSFTPGSFFVPTIGELNISLSSAEFASDFNGTVLATFLAPVPEPSSFALLGLGLAGLVVAASWPRSPPIGALRKGQTRLPS